MKFLNKYNYISFVLLFLVIVAQFVPFTNSAKLYSEVEDMGKTWAELPVGITGKDKSSWPPEIKYGELKIGKNLYRKNIHCTAKKQFPSLLTFGILLALFTVQK